MQLGPWLESIDWYPLIGWGVPIIFTIIVVLWFIHDVRTKGATPRYARPAPPPADGSGGISAAHGADISYLPNERGGSKGGLPVSGMGPEGRGGYGSRPHDEDE